jgi:tetratricopeptide (TPR) repeat protein
LHEVRGEINPRTEPVLTVVLLSRACTAVGDLAGAEEVLDQAAAARPEQVVLLNALGKLLERQGAARREEAIGYYRAARGQRRSLGIALSLALARAGRATQGEQIMQDLALQQPGNPVVHSYLAYNLSGQQKHGAAEVAYRKAVALKPHYVEAYCNLGIALHRQGKHGAAEAAYRQAIALKPGLAEAYSNLGSALNNQRKHVAAVAAYRKAIALKPDYGTAYYNLGIELRHLGRFHEAAAALKKGADLLPERTPQHGQARQLQQQCLRLAAMDPRLPRILKGTEKPASATEQIEFAQLCHLKQLHAAAARLYADAFAAVPRWADDLNARHRYSAAQAAALAGCGRGKDAAGVEETARARWRTQARQRLRADLAALVRVLGAAPAARRGGVRMVLMQMREDPNLTCVRDPGELDKLTADERKEYLALWADVAAALARTEK